MPTKKMKWNEVRYYLEEARSCEDRQKKELMERNAYPLMIKYYEGDQSTSDGNSKLAIINEYFPNVNSIIAETMYQNPDVITNPTKPQAELDAPIMNSALQYAFNKLDAVTENRLALFDMIMAGYCAVEVNHINVDNVSNAPRPIEQPTIFENIKTQVKKLTESSSSEEIEEDLEKSIPTAEERYSTPDETYLRRWNPLDVLFDYRADRIKDIRYTIKKIRFSQAEFIARYPEYKNKIRSGQTIPFTQHLMEQDKKTVLLYEFQVKKKDKVVSFLLSPDYETSEVDYWERPYTTNGFNLKIGTLHEYGTLYPVSFAKINKAIQDDLNNYTTFMMEVAERNIPKRGYNKDKVKLDGLTALNSSRVNDAVPVQGGQESIWTIQNTNVSVENKELMALMDKHKDKLWGISAQRQGESGKAKFATELEIQEAGFQSKQSDLQEGLRKLLREELDTLKDIIVQFWDEPMWFKITGGPKPGWYEPEVDPVSGMVLNPLTEILTMDYDIDVDISSSLKPNKEKRKRELIDFVTFLINPATIQFAQMHGVIPDLEIIKKAAKEWGWNPENLFKEIPPEMLAAMQQPQEE